MDMIVYYHAICRLRRRFCARKGRAFLATQHLTDGRTNERTTETVFYFRETDLKPGKLW